MQQVAFNWDITYACQLRCTHCYSESGRRQARTLPVEDLRRVADAMIAMNPLSVQLSGGEPLLVKGIFEIAQRFVDAGVPVELYTNGLLVDEERLPEILRLFSVVHVSLDGATAATHDTVRGVEGSFDGALRALALLNQAAAERRAAGGKVPFRIEWTLVRRNFPELERLAADIAPRFPEMSFVMVGAAAPAGLASSARYAATELLGEAELALVRDRAFVARLRALAPTTLERFTLLDNFFLQLNPAHIEPGTLPLGVLQVEPDAGVRGMIMYEGTVGNLLRDPPESILARVEQRIRDPFVAEALASATTPIEWAKATRAIDRRFAAERELVRLAKRDRAEEEERLALCG